MVTGFRWLALETWFLDRAVRFYGDVLDCSVETGDAETATVALGDHELRLVAPGPVPRGGVHVHYALSTPPDRYDAWVDRLGVHGEIWEHEFGSTRSVYTYDPDDHCVEIGDNGSGDAPLTGVFEVALEVESLDRATGFYEAFGFDVVDEGGDRRRTRLDGPIAVELWEPQRGLAEARGGVHVDLGFVAPDPTAAIAPVTNSARSVDELEDGVRVQDPDGHYLTVIPA